MANDAATARGEVHVVLTGADGQVKHEETQKNIITAVGNQVYAERGGGVAGALAAPTGMALGTGTTAAATTLAGAAMVAGIAGSAQAWTTLPASGTGGAGTSRRITYVMTWAAGVATNTSPGINEVVLQNGTATTVPANGTSQSVTVARAVLSTPVLKGASDSLTITWTHDLGS